jgi:hypothetical protein
MKIDWSKWYFRPQEQTDAQGNKYFSGTILLSNPSENVTYFYYLFGDDDFNKTALSAPDDALKLIKEYCKREIRRNIVNFELNRLAGQQLPIEDNLDYIENEAERRGLI